MPTLRLPLLLPALLLAAAPLAAQPPASAASARAEDVVAAARRTLAARYVLPEVAARLDAALATRAAAGDYRGLSGAALADRIQATLRAVTPDKHLSVTYDPPLATMLAAQPAGQADDAPPPPGMARMLEVNNAGVRELRLLPGNIRYFAYDGFAWGTPAAEQALATAMRFLRGGDAYIIDLRRNGGGDPGAVAALTSYFVPAGTPLMRFEMRGRAGETTRAPAAPFTLAGKPLFVLTSANSVSAAEEFATHVQALGFGTLVGERTAGGGFRNDFVALPGGLVLSVSTGRAISLKTGRDWEGVGVSPTIATSADAALDQAQQAAITRIAATAPAGERAQLAVLAERYRALATPFAPTRATAAYAGTYGVRTVRAAEGGGLTVERAGRPRLRLIPTGPDTFVTDADMPARLVFAEQGGRMQLTVTQPDGSATTAPRG